MVKILVVEDEKSLRLLYKKDLEQYGYQVVAAGNAVEGPPGAGDRVAAPRGPGHPVLEARTERVVDRRLPSVA